MRPQDILVLIKLHLWERGRWKIASIAESIYLSPSETHGAIKRLEKASLFDPVLEKPKQDAMEEFIIHGLKYVYPAEMGPQTRGIPTAHAAVPMSKLVVSEANDIVVWPSADGKKRGQSLKPLYRTAPEASAVDPNLYEFLTLIDCLRVGRAREQALAKEELIKRIRKKP
jgi:hypothetical protein